MESNRRPDLTTPAQQLDALHRNREVLARRVGTPLWVQALYGIVVAAFAVGFAFRPDTPLMGVWVAVAVVAIEALRRNRGRGGAKSAPASWPLTILGIIATLALAIAARIMWTLGVAWPLVTLVALLAGAATFAVGVLDDHARLRWMQEHL